MWLTGSIQAETGNLRIGATEQGVIQLAYLAVVFALVMLARSVLRLARGVGPKKGLGRVRPGAAKALALLLIVPAVSGFAYLTLGQLFEIWLVDVLRPLAIAEAVLLVMLAAEQFWPVRTTDTVVTPVSVP
jgi:hypothetical protein